jgi:hypothetical protein
MSDVIVERKVLREEKYVVTYSDQSIMIKEVRLSYPHLDKPWAMGGDKPKYSAYGLMPKTPAYAKSKALIDAAIQKIATDKQSPNLPATQRFFRDGDETDKRSFKGHWSISASEDTRPGLRGRGVDPITGRARMIAPEEITEVFYPGCWVNLLVKPWWQSNTYGKRVNANLVAVQFVRDDQKIVGEGRIGDDAIDDSFGVLPEDESGFEDDL